MKNYITTFSTHSTLEQAETMKKEFQSKEIVMVPHQVSLLELRDLVNQDIEFPITIDLESDELL